MKILHTSDLHFGISLCGVPLLPYQKEFCKALCELSEQADAVIIAGDIFDTSVASAEAVKCWSGLVSELCLERKIPVIVCAGNHDGAARLASCADLLKAAGLYISGALEDAFVPVNIGNAAVYSLPYLNPSDAAAVLNCKPSAAEVMKTVCGKILESADRTKCNILLAHCFAAGGQASESDISARAAESAGGAELIPAEVFAGFDYVALGHLHRAQTLKCGTLIRYSGTPLPYSFGEARYEKSVTLFDTETHEITELPVPQPYTLRTVEDEYEKIIGLAETDKNRNDFMKITVADRYAGDSVFLRLKELYPNLLQFSGKQYEAAAGGGITAKEASELDIISLAARYCQEHRGEAPDEDEMKWLSEALRDIDNEESL